MQLVGEIIHSWATFEYEKHILPKASHPLANLYLAACSHDENEFVFQIQKVKDTSTKLFAALSKEMQQQHCQDDFQATKDAVASIAKKTLESIKDKGQIFGTIFQLLQPQTDDSQWGEKEAYRNTVFLIHALDMHGHLEKLAKTCQIWQGVDKNHLAHKYLIDGRPALPKGKIYYINGIGTTLDIARWDAIRFSDHLANGFNITGILNPSQGTAHDVAMTPLYAKGSMPHAVKLLLNEWANFFYTRPLNEKLLQICFSQGAIHVKNALDHMEPELRGRVCVIAIAPAHFFAKSEAQIVHFYKWEDFVTSVAYNKERINEKDPDCIRVLKDDGAAHHDPHGNNYIQAIRPYVQRYIETNSIKE